MPARSAELNKDVKLNISSRIYDTHPDLYLGRPLGHLIVSLMALKRDPIY